MGPGLVVAALLALCAPGAVQAGLPETPRLRQITVADGLPSNRINAIAEDRSGYLWIATSDGLARYDGAGYRVWRTEDGLRDNFIWSVHVDREDRVWIGTERGGLSMLDASRQRLTTLHRGNTPGLGSDTVWAIASTPDGSLWFGTEDAGLHRRDRNGRLQRFMPRAGDPRSVPDARVSHLAVGRDGRLWVGTKSGVAHWTGRGFARLPLSAQHAPGVESLTVEDDGTLWIGTTRGVSVRRPSGRIELAPWGENRRVLNTLLRDRAGQYWLDILDGLGRDELGAVANVPLYSQLAQGLVKPSWIDALQDRNGGLWFASYGNGLWYLPATWRQFTLLSRAAGDEQSLGNAHVRGIANAGDGRMWLVGSGGTLDRLDPETGAVEHHRHEVGGGALPVAVFEDSRGAVWVGYSKGIARLRDEQLQRWSAADAVDPAPDMISLAFAESGDGRVWILSNAVELQARDADGAVVARVRPGDGHGLPADAQPRAILAGPDGALWVAGTHGLSMWNAGTRRFEPVPGAPARSIAAVARAGADEVWLAGRGTLSRHRWDGERLRTLDGFGIDDGLPALEPSGIAIDAAGIAWVTSTRGLLRLDPRARSTRLYGVRSGLPSQEFDGPPVARHGDGRLLIGHPDGLLMFDPAVVRPPTEQPPLAIESVDVRRGDARVALATDGADGTLQLDAGDRDLRIVARLLSFEDPRSHAYRFRLSGHDRGWVEAGAEGERVYSQLAPGGYRLQVQARAAGGGWSPARTLAFDVAPPWWRTWPARVGLVALLALLLWWIADAYRVRLKRRHRWALAKRERELAEQASLAKTRFLATLGHEVRTPMTGVLGMSELLLGTELDAQQRGYVRSIHGAGEHLLRLVNDALDLARIESGKLELAEDAFDLRALLDDVVALVGPLARQRGLRFELSVAADAPHWLCGDAARVRQILLNLLGNAVKFTERGAVSLHAAARGDGGGVRLVVADTGPGLNDEQKARLFRRFEQAEGARTAARYGGSGLGLAICQELAAAMDGSITVDSAPGEGTRFSVELPLAAAQAPRELASAPAPAARTPARSLLLVEDEPTVAAVVVALLEAQGHRVAHAPHALAALAEVAARRFDAGLLDLDLPGMDGFALARQLRAQGMTMPLVALTARADADAEPLSRDAGFDRFVRKPVTGAMLAELLASLELGEPAAA